MCLVLGDALDFRGVHAVQLGRFAFLALFALAPDTPAELKQPGQMAVLRLCLIGLIGLGLALNALDDAAQVSAQLSGLRLSPVVLARMGVALGAHKGGAPHIAVALAQNHAQLVRMAHQGKSGFVQ